MEDVTHARALRSARAWCGHRISLKPMWLDRKSERENSGESSQMSREVDNAYRPYSRPL